MDLELNELKSAIQGRKLVIYGAGNWASAFWAFIEYLDYGGNVVCFTVTELEGCDVNLFNKDVKMFKDIKNSISDCVIIIAVKRADEIISILSENQIKDYYRLREAQVDKIQAYIFDTYSRLPIQRNKIFVDCFEGKNGYCCNCKYIVEKLYSMKYPVEVVWNIIDESMWEFPHGIKTVRYKSLEYFKELYTSGIVINNADVISYPYKRKEQYFINTWHGSGPFKKVRAALCNNDKEKISKIKSEYSLVDVFYSNTKDNTEMFRNSFCFDGEICEGGSPRNDILFTRNDIKEQIFNKFDIDNDKKILLYAPTYRKGGKDRLMSFNWYDLDMQQVLCALNNRFGGEFILMYRFHHMLYEYKKNCDYYYFGIDVTYYPDIMELLVAADVLITDYSSVMWDFSLQRRPVFLYHNDESEYLNEHGFYWPISKWPYPKAHTCEELCGKIKKFNEKEYLEDLEAFFAADTSYDDGNASGRVAERIIDVINNPQKYGKE